MSDDEEEDGQISKYEEYEDKAKPGGNKPSSDDEPVTVEDLNKARITRDMISKYCYAPWFEDLMKGTVNVHLRVYHA